MENPGQSGSPNPSDDSASQPNGSSSSGALENVNPCSLLTADVAEQLQLGAGRQAPPTPANKSRACNYDSTDYGAQVIIFDSVPYKRNVAGQRMTPVSIPGADRPALQYRQGGGVCGIAMYVSETSSVDVTGTFASGDQVKACELAELGARAVESKLPES